MEPREAGVVILAAGRSERMKEMKPFLQYDDSNRFIDKIISTYSGWGCREIIVVTNREAIPLMKQIETESSTFVLVCNDNLNFERFFSVKLGLGAFRSSSFCFIQNVDNPFIDSKILDLLYRHRSDKKYISPVFKNRGGHPVLLNRENIRRICDWSDNSANFKAVLGMMECLEVEMPDDRVLININSPEEYSRWFTERQHGINV